MWIRRFILWFWKRRGVMQRTLILLKPDAIQRRLVGTLIGRFEQKGLRLVGLKLVVPTAEQVWTGNPFRLPFLMLS